VLSGAFDLSSAGPLREHIDVVLAKRADEPTLVFDLSEVGRLEASAFAAIVAAARRIVSDGRHVGVVKPRAEIWAAFELTALDDLFEPFDSGADLRGRLDCRTEL